MRSIGALVGALLIGFGALILVASETESGHTFGMVLVVVGGVVFLCTLIFPGQIARSIQRAAKYLWTKKL